MAWTEDEAQRQLFGYLLRKLTRETASVHLDGAALLEKDGFDISLAGPAQEQMLIAIESVQRIFVLLSKQQPYGPIGQKESLQNGKVYD